MRCSERVPKCHRTIFISDTHLGTRGCKANQLAVSYISNFQETAAREARLRGFDGAVCGHIHHAPIEHIGGVLYLNDGDWVESCTARISYSR